MNVQKSLIKDINDIRTGPVTKTIENEIFEAGCHVSAVEDEALEIVIRHGDLVYRLRRTRIQTFELADELRSLIQEALPLLVVARREALQKGNGSLARLFAPSVVSSFKVLDDPVYAAIEEAEEPYQLYAQPGTVNLIIGDNLSWGCEYRMLETEAHQLLREIDDAIMYWDEYA